MQSDGIGQQASYDITHQGLGYFLTIRGDRIEAAPSDFFARLGYTESPGLPPEQLLHPDDWRGLQNDLARVGATAHLLPHWKPQRYADFARQWRPHARRGWRG